MREDKHSRAELGQTICISRDWSSVAKFIKQVHQTAEGTASKREQLGKPPIQLVEFRDRFMNTHQPIHLLDAIHWTYDTLATNPRDKIFALLGLCHDGPTFVLLLNYRQSLETILTDMYKLMIRMNRSLDLICMRETRSLRDSNLLTWVLNWPSMWSDSMTVQESNFMRWHKSFRFSPVLDGSTNDALTVSGTYRGTVKAATSEMRRDLTYGERLLPPYWTTPVPTQEWDETHMDS